MVLQGLKSNYEADLNETIRKTAKIREEITRLDKLGVDLTAKANVIAGKIEGIKEIPDTEIMPEVKTQMLDKYDAQLIEIVNNMDRLRHEIQRLKKLLEDTEVKCIWLTGKVDAMKEFFDLENGVAPPVEQKEGNEHV